MLDIKAHGRLSFPFVSGSVFCASLLAAVACQQTAPAQHASNAPVAAPGATAISSVEQRGPSKPSAPITLQIAKSADGNNIVLTATAELALEQVQLRIDQQNMPEVNMAKGETISYTVRWSDVRASNEVIGTASMMLNGRRIGKAIALPTSSALAAPAPVTSITLPDGTVVQEAK
jgi:hypothetical protein